MLHEGGATVSSGLLPFDATAGERENRSVMARQNPAVRHTEDALMNPPEHKTPDMKDVCCFIPELH